MSQFSADTITEFTPHVLKILGFQELMETLSTLETVYTLLDLSCTFGKPNSGAALAFHLGVECGKAKRTE